MLVQLAAHIFVLVALKLFLNSLLYNFLIIILKFSIKKNCLNGAQYFPLAKMRLPPPPNYRHIISKK